MLLAAGGTRGRRRNAAKSKAVHGHHPARALLRTSGRSSAACGSRPVSDPQAHRRVLPRGLSRVRRQARRFAAVLQAAVVPQGWSANDAFLEAPIAPPRLCTGPLYTFEAYLGAAMDVSERLAGRAYLSRRDLLARHRRASVLQKCAGAQARARHLVASMPLWSVCSLATFYDTPSGRSASPTHGTSRLPCGLPLALRLAGAALGRGHPLCFRWRPHRGRLNLTSLSDGAHHAAIDAERGAGGGARRLAAEIDDEIGDFVRLGHAPDQRGGPQRA